MEPAAIGIDGDSLEIVHADEEGFATESRPFRSSRNTALVSSLTVYRAVPSWFRVSPEVRSIPLSCP